MQMFHEQSLVLQPKINNPYTFSQEIIDLRFVLMSFPFQRQSLLARLIELMTEIGSLTVHMV